MQRHHGLVRTLAIVGAGIIVFCLGRVTYGENAGPAEPFFRESADARADLAAAMINAKRENRRILVVWGGNWSDACNSLHDLITNHQSVSHKINYEYEVVPIDVGRWDRNMDLAGKYRIDLRWHGVPHLTIMDADGVVLTHADVKSLESSGRIDARKLITVLTEHQAPYLQATDVLRDAIAEATRTKKRTFLYFGAPWCEKCRSYDQWLQLPEVSPLVNKDFHVVKIDVNRTVGGQKMLNDLRVAGYGIPWVAVLDEEGAMITSSTTPEGTNIGFPYTDWELDHFRNMLHVASVQMTSDEIGRIIESMRVFHPALQPTMP